MYDFQTFNPHTIRQKLFIKDEENKKWYDEKNEWENEKTEKSDDDNER